MNNVLLDVMKKTAPRLNKDVTDGAAKKILEIIPEYFDDIIRSSIKSLNILSLFVSMIPVKVVLVLLCFHPDTVRYFTPP